MLRRVVLVVLSLWGISVAAGGAEFKPDPASVRRDGPAYRYPQAGWIVLHVEGEPYERGMQQGKLLSGEIAEYIKCFALEQSSKSPEEGWKLVRTMTDALFLRRFDEELLVEMKGIADGAAAGGAKFDGRAVDLTDIVAINVWPELMSLDWALHAEPTGLEGKTLGKSAATLPGRKADRCSAFAATGPATKDGKAMIGHITMFDIYPCNFFNVWIDVKPAKGHRLVFQAGPGSVQSGMDWYMNDAGIVLTETTIWQTTFDSNGLSIGSRSRRAVQYGDSIDSVVKLLGDEGNGLYTNEWLLADMKTNEIAMFELGTKTSRLMRSSKNEWFGNTAGFYWGNNNTKDLSVRMETIAAVNDRPADMTFVPEPRDIAWQRLFEQNKGKMDADFGKLAFSKPPIVSRNSCDAKYTTADMAMQMKSFALWGDPYGQLWEPSPAEHEKFHDAAPIVPNDWTVLTTEAPVAEAAGAAKAVDLKGGDGSDADEESAGSAGDDEDDEGDVEPKVAWHGTILPASDGDIWLASAFAQFHGYVTRENELLRKHKKDKEKDVAKDADRWESLTTDERDELGVRLFHYRAAVMSKGISKLSIPLRKITSDVADDGWFYSASGRGLLLLSDLRRRLGADTFDAAMDAFGREHAGKAVDSEAFAAAMSDAGGAGLKDYFMHWLDRADALPTLEMGGVSSEKKDSDFIVNGEVISHGPIPPSSIDVTLETEDGETTKTFAFEASRAKFHMTSDKKVLRAVINKYGQTPIANGWNWSGSSFKRDLEHTLIIYGTRTEAVGNRIAAEKLRQGIVNQWEHLALEVKADTSVSEDELRGHHLLLIGRPACSALTERLCGSLPVTFGPGSFVVRGQTYANPESGVIAARVNPMDAEYSLVCVAGLSPGATLRAATALGGGASAPIKVLPGKGKAKDIAPPAVELSRELN